MDSSLPQVVVNPVAVERTDTPVVSVKHSRPLFVTMICSFYFVYWAINIIALIATLLMRIGSQFPAFKDIINQISLILLSAQVNVSAISWVIAIGLLAGVIGLWFAQRWSIIIYAAASVALFIITLPPTSSAPNTALYAALIAYTLATTFSVNIATIVIGSIYFRRMK